MLVIKHQTSSFLIRVWNRIGISRRRMFCTSSSGNGDSDIKCGDPECKGAKRSTKTRNKSLDNGPHVNPSQKESTSYEESSKRKQNTEFWEFLDREQNTLKKSTRNTLNYTKRKKTSTFVYEKPLPNSKQSLISKDDFQLKNETESTKQLNDKEFPKKLRNELTKNETESTKQRNDKKFPKKLRNELTKNETESTKQRNGKDFPKILRNELNKSIEIEDHHIIKKITNADGDVIYLEWCYAYVRPGKFHARGGRAKLHHTCRVCRRTCLHLIGKYGTGDRKCLACAADQLGWHGDDVPSWYFHRNCGHCKKQK